MDKLTDDQGIRAAIGHYAEGMRTHNVNALKRGFHDQATLCGYLGDDVIAGPIAVLYDYVAANPSPDAAGVPYACDILRIDVTRRAASVMVREDYHGVGIDYFHLIKIGDQWSIVGKLWDSEA